MKIFKLMAMMTCVLFSSAAMAQDVWFETNYSADEQESGCGVRHILYDHSSNGEISMLWVASSICSGEVAFSESVVFSQNTMKAWPVLLHKAAAWADSDMSGVAFNLHHWGDGIVVNVLRRVDVLGEANVYFSIQNTAFSGELQRPLLVSVSEGAWRTLSNIIAGKAFVKLVAP